jgi:hypothetical protein
MNSMSKLRAATTNWGVEASGILGFRYWGFFFAAFVLAAGVAGAIYRHLDLPQNYSEFIVGNIAWSYQNKFHDYAVLYSLVISFFLILVAIACIAVRLGRIAGSGAIGRLHDSILILCLPAVVWLSGLLTSKSTSLGLLNLSQILLFSGLVFAGLLTFRDTRMWSERPHRIFDVLHTALLFLILAGLAVAAVGVATNRIGAMLEVQKWMDQQALYRWLKIILTGSFLLICGLIVNARVPDEMCSVMRRLVLGAQCFLPLFWLCLIPPALVSPETAKLVSGYPLTASGKFLVWSVMGLVYLEMLVRFKRGCLRTKDAMALDLLTIGSVIGLLLFLKTPPSSLPSLMSDDYHFGEVLVPWWSWFKLGLLPFWDYAPARGLVNYFPGMFSSLVFGGAPATIGAAYPFIYAVIAGLAFFALQPVLGIGGVFIALLLGPFANGIGEIDLAVSIFLATFCWGWSKWRVERWLVAFAVCGVAILLYAPGQGALVLVACAPLALGALWRLYRTSLRWMLQMLAGILGVTTVIFALTPLGKMVLGALRYGVEQSQINSMAHGINWNASFGTESINAWAFELLRASFVLVAMWAAVLVFKALFERDRALGKRVLTYALPILIISLLFVIRAAGRIDPGASRLGIASAWALSLLFPMLLYVSVRVRAIHVVAWVALGALLLPQIGRTSMAGYANDLTSNFNALDAGNLRTSANVRTIENGRLGSAMADPVHLARIVAVRNLLDQVLEAQETFLDVSGRHAMYFYVDRKPALESAAMYNLVGESQQLRAMKSIRTDHVPAILLSADNLLHDGGPSSLRSNLVYRELMLSNDYKVVAVGGQVWMIRSDRLGRLRPDAATSIVDLNESAVNMLDPIYRKQNLEFLPASWGRSSRSLSSKFSAVFRIATEKPDSGKSVDALGEGRYLITGEDPHVRFDLSANNLAGRQAGLLSFDFSCESPDAVPTIGLHWSTPKTPEGSTTFLTFRGQQGRLIVPVDSAPSWLLADRIGTVRFDIDGDDTGCKKFSIRNVELLARKATLTH